jgi:hypothetical protein
MSGTNFVEIFPYIGASLTLLLGLLGVFAPARAATLWDVADSAAHPMIRIHLGGMWLFLGAFNLYSHSPSAFWTCGAAWLGALVLRIVLRIVLTSGQNGKPLTWRCAAIELAIAATMLITFFTY